MVIRSSASRRQICTAGGHDFVVRISRSVSSFREVCHTEFGDIVVVYRSGASIVSSPVNARKSRGRFEEVKSGQAPYDRKH